MKNLTNFTLKIREVFVLHILDQIQSPEDVKKLPAEQIPQLCDEIRAFLSGLLDHMGYSAIVRVYQTEKGRYKVILDGQGLGGLIGRRGETLDAMQQLTGYAVNRSGSRVRVQLDAEHYRAKREAALCQLARKTADKVVAGHRSFTLEPMNAYERHVIHMALQDVPNVSTHSTGIDPNRRVVVTYTRDEES